jgi:hypothetical protein
MANIKENKKYHYTYKTTNLINGRYYLGMHSTNRLDDGYLGSGKRLYYELNKYGRNNFKFEILQHFNTREQLVEAETSLISEEVLKDPNCLNMVVGGSGGNVGKGGEHLGGDCWAAANRYWKTEEGLKKKSETAKKVAKRRIQEGTWNVFQKGNQVWKGRKHTPESIEKMKETKKGHGKGVNNSQFGKCWITNEVESKKIHKGDLIPEGWRLGRKIK